MVYETAFNLKLPTKHHGAFELVVLTMFSENKSLSYVMGTGFFGEIFIARKMPKTMEFVLRSMFISF